MYKVVVLDCDNGEVITKWTMTAAQAEAIRVFWNATCYDDYIVTFERVGESVKDISNDVYKEN